MRFSVLGPLEVRTADGDSVAVRAGRTRSLLHLLLLHRRVVQPVEVIVDRIWGEDPPVDAANAVHQLVSYLRRTLGAEGREVLQTTSAGYLLHVADEDVDAWRMEHLVHRAAGGSTAPDRASVEGALRDASAAVRLWRGEPYPESAQFEWTSGDRARLQDVYLQAQETRVEALLRLGQHREAVLEAQSLTAAYPLRETFHAQLALALYRSGRQSDALEVHRAVRELLARELGLDPSQELRELERAILNQDPALDQQPLQGPAQDQATVQPPAPTSPVAVEGSDQSAARAPAPQPLVVPATALLGRERDLALAVEGVRPGSVHTVTGVAGVGKTRLALAAASASGAPVWYADLAGLGEVADVPATVAAAVGLATPGPAPGTDTLVAAFVEAEGVLLLDNCEGVVAAVADLCSRIRSVAPGLAVLATSRRPLGAPGEVVQRLNPLPVPPEEETGREVIERSPAVRLWTERARALDATLVLDDAALVDVAHIVRRVDGIPLAIELAAGHADVSSTRTIRDRLEARLDSLAAATPSTGGRTRSLTAAIEASVALLTPEEREFLMALSVFPGSFDSYAAAAVTGLEEGPAFQLLTALVRQSLVAVDQPYRLLAPVRAHAAASAATGLDVAVLRDRHAGWVGDLAWEHWQRTGGLRHTQDLGELRPLMADARVALEWALSQEDVATASRVAVGFSWVWTLHGRTDEGFSWLTEVKRLSDAVPVRDAEEAVIRAAVLRSLGLLANPRGELALARELCREAADLSLEHGDGDGAAAALLTLTVSHWALGDFEASRAAATRALEQVADRPDSWYAVTGTVLAARTALDAGDPDAADLVDAAVGVAQEAGDAHMLGFALACQARSARLQGEVGAATIAAEEALRVWRTIAYTEGEMMVLNLLSRLETDAGEHVSAAPLAAEALRVATRTGHRGGRCEAVESLALAAAGEGRREHALLLLLVSARERDRLGAPVPAADAGRLEAVLGELEQALGGAAAMVRARARLTRMDDLVAELAAGVPA